MSLPSKLGVDASPAPATSGWPPVADVSQLLAERAAAGIPTRPRGGATKLGWGSCGAPPNGCQDLDTRSLTGVLEHNAGDLTAVVGAGTPLVELADRLALSGQRLALDPPLGFERAATVGGVCAAGDSGPLRHRYGAPRDLVLGMRVVLSDGAVAQAGSKVIKNVAGYDLPKLFCGSLGTLGVIAELCLRLHPLPAQTATTMIDCGDPATLARVCTALSSAPLEAESLDLAWRRGRGGVLARFAGERASARAASALELLAGAGVDGDTRDGDDEPLWDSQRELQRAPQGGISIRVSGRPTRLAETARLTDDIGAALVGRAALGLWWVTLGPDSDHAAALSLLRERLAPLPCAVLDAPEQLREQIDAWGPRTAGLVALERRVRERFDLAGLLNPSVPVGR